MCPHAVGGVSAQRVSVLVDTMAEKTSALRPIFSLKTRKSVHIHYYSLLVRIDMFVYVHELAFSLAPINGVLAPSQLRVDVDSG